MKKISAFLLVFVTGMFSVAYGLGAENLKLTKTVVTSDKMITDNINHKIHFIGNVEAHHEDVTLKADDVEVYSDEKNETLSKIIASGNVVVTKGERKIVGGHAELYYQQRQVVVTENPIITDKENRISGEKITYSYDKEGIIIEGGKQNKAQLLLKAPEKERKR